MQDSRARKRKASNQLSEYYDTDDRNHVRTVRAWLGQDNASRRQLPGWSPSNYIGLEADVSKREAVVAAFRHAWLAYERDAMGADEYHPISHQGSNLTEAGGIGYTVVDALDTMLLMGLDAEYQRARSWVEHKMTFERDAAFSTFETTIRVLGGLLSAYHLSGGDPLYLTRARDLGDRLLPVFDTPSGLPLPMVNLQRREGVWSQEGHGIVSTAEASTLQLEFRYLSELTDEDVYWKKAERVMAVVKAARMPPGLASIFMDPREGRFVTSAIRLGSRGDSYYEYLLKQFIQTDRTEGVYREMYEDAVGAIHDHLVQKSLTSGLIYTAELIPERNSADPYGELSWRLTPKQDFLVCFFGGNLLLGATRSGALVEDVSVPPRLEELSEMGRRDWNTGVELIRTCLATHDTKTGLAPEIAHFRIPSDNLNGMQNAPGDWYIKGARVGEFPPYDARYMLRPETVESLFIAFRLTGDKRYRDYGWAIFQAIEKHCRIPSGGYATIVNVDEVPVRHEDKMETFFLGETLKYLFLLFSDGDKIPLSKYVFNTEAHPLPIFTPSIRTGFS
ncbi:glycoside hydrolase [Multifurca ochricompacta]|uniref:alpha-1,2-Mannosidase n=1 Tax=Multifurca ochricompacta TaxID=376703 RepID=A0AAD4M0Q1_9AGAM|nr:glycoside hydrolase [Multifurca ochricompacta]